MQDPIEYAKQIAYSSEIVLRFTFEKAKEYADKPGVYVECGVAAGAQIIAMAAGAPNKTIYAFDSFEGIPLPSNKDNQMPGIKFLSKEEQGKLPNPGEQELKSSGATAVSYGDFTEHLCQAFYPSLGKSGTLTKLLNVLPVEGWFEETLPEITPFMEPISLLRLDGDLYNSTYICLKYLYPKVIEGGLVIIDDWALPGCRQAVEDYFIGNGIGDFKCHWLKMQFIKDENSTVAYWIK
jgi:hypothetical protein